MNRSSQFLLAVTALVGLGAAHSAQAQTAYAIANNGSLLISFNLATPGTVTTIGAFSGAATVIDDIDFRVSNGLLYGYSQASNQVVTINPATGATTFVSTPSVASGTNNVGIDFNPVADRLRIVNNNNQNLRVNVATGATTNDQALSYAVGDVNAGNQPRIRDVAYTNNNNSGAGTTIYYLDAPHHTLVTTATPNGPGGSVGFLNTVGALGATQNNNFGFDIFTSGGGVNSAYGIFDSTTILGGPPTLYSINLTTGAASLIGGINAPGNAVAPISPITGFAITPDVAAATPEPGSIALLAGMATVGAGMIRRRRARK